MYKIKQTNVPPHKGNEEIVTENVIEMSHSTVSNSELITTSSKENITQEAPHSEISSTVQRLATSKLNEYTTSVEQEESEETCSCSSAKHISSASESKQVETLTTNGNAFTSKHGKTSDLILQSEVSAEGTTSVQLRVTETSITQEDLKQQSGGVPSQTALEITSHVLSFEPNVKTELPRNETSEGHSMPATPEEIETSLGYSIELPGMISATQMQTSDNSAATDEGIENTSCWEISELSDNSTTESSEIADLTSNEESTSRQISTENNTETLASVNQPTESNTSQVQKETSVEHETTSEMASEIATLTNETRQTSTLEECEECEENITETLFNIQPTAGSNLHTTKISETVIGGFEISHKANGGISSTTTLEELSSKQNIAIDTEMTTAISSSIKGEVVTAETHVNEGTVHEGLEISNTDKKGITSEVSSIQSIAMSSESATSIVSEVVSLQNPTENNGSTPEKAHEPNVEEPQVTSTPSITEITTGETHVTTAVYEQTLITSPGSEMINTAKEGPSITTIGEPTSKQNINMETETYTNTVSATTSLQSPTVNNSVHSEETLAPKTENGTARGTSEIPHTGKEGMLSTMTQSITMNNETTTVTQVASIKTSTEPNGTSSGEASPGRSTAAEEVSEEYYRTATYEINANTSEIIKGKEGSIDVISNVADENMTRHPTIYLDFTSSESSSTQEVEKNLAITSNMVNIGSTTFITESNAELEEQSNTTALSSETNIKLTSTPSKTALPEGNDRGPTEITKLITYLPSEIPETKQAYSLNSNEQSTVWNQSTSIEQIAIQHSSVTSKTEPSVILDQSLETTTLSITGSVFTGIANTTEATAVMATYIGGGGSATKIEVTEHGSTPGVQTSVESQSTRQEFSSAKTEENVGAIEAGSTEQYAGTVEGHSTTTVEINSLSVETTSTSIEIDTNAMVGEASTIHSSIVSTEQTSSSITGSIAYTITEGQRPLLNNVSEATYYIETSSKAPSVDYTNKPSEYSSQFSMETGTYFGTYTASSTSESEKGTTKTESKTHSMESEVLGTTTNLHDTQETLTDTAASSNEAIPVNVPSLINNAEPNSEVTLITSEGATELLGTVSNTQMQSGNNFTDEYIESTSCWEISETPGNNTVTEVTQIGGSTSSKEKMSEITHESTQVSPSTGHPTESKSSQISENHSTELQKETAEHEVTGGIASEGQSQKNAETLNEGMTQSILPSKGMSIEQSQVSTNGMENERTGATISQFENTTEVSEMRASSSTPFRHSSTHGEVPYQTATKQESSTTREPSEESNEGHSTGDSQAGTSVAPLEIVLQTTEYPDTKETSKQSTMETGATSEGPSESLTVKKEDVSGTHSVGTTRTSEVTSIYVTEVTVEQTETFSGGVSLQDHSSEYPENASISKKTTSSNETTTQINVGYEHHSSSLTESEEKSPELSTASEKLIAQEHSMGTGCTEFNENMETTTNRISSVEEFYGSHMPTTEMGRTGEHFSVTQSIQHTALSTGEVGTSFSVHPMETQQPKVSSASTTTTSSQVPTSEVIVTHTKSQVSELSSISTSISDHTGSETHVQTNGNTTGVTIRQCECHIVNQTNVIPNKRVEVKIYIQGNSSEETIQILTENIPVSKTDTPGLTNEPTKKPDQFVSETSAFAPDHHTSTAGKVSAKATAMSEAQIDQTVAFPEIPASKATITVRDVHDEEPLDEFAFSRHETSTICDECQHGKAGKVKKKKPEESSDAFGFNKHETSTICEMCQSEQGTSEEKSKPQSNMDIVEELDEFNFKGKGETSTLCEICESGEEAVTNKHDLATPSPAPSPKEEMDAFNFHNKHEPTLCELCSDLGTTIQNTEPLLTSQGPAEKQNEKTISQKFETVVTSNVVATSSRKHVTSTSGEESTPSIQEHVTGTTEIGEYKTTAEKQSTVLKSIGGSTTNGNQGTTKGNSESQEKKASPTTETWKEQEEDITVEVTVTVHNTEHLGTSSSTTGSRTDSGTQEESESEQTTYSGETVLTSARFEQATDSVITVVTENGVSLFEASSNRKHLTSTSEEELNASAEEHKIETMASIQPTEPLGRTAKTTEFHTEISTIYGKHATADQEESELEQTTSRGETVHKSETYEQSTAPEEVTENRTSRKYLVSASEEEQGTSAEATETGEHRSHHERQTTLSKNIEGNTAWEKLDENQETTKGTSRNHKHYSMFKTKTWKEEDEDMTAEVTVSVRHTQHPGTSSRTTGFHTSSESSMTIGEHTTETFEEESEPERSTVVKTVYTEEVTETASGINPGERNSFSTEETEEPGHIVAENFKTTKTTTEEVTQEELSNKGSKQSSEVSTSVPTSEGSTSSTEQSGEVSRAETTKNVEIQEETSTEGNKLRTEIYTNESANEEIHERPSSEGTGESTSESTSEEISMVETTKEAEEPSAEKSTEVSASESSSEENNISTIEKAEEISTGSQTKEETGMSKTEADHEGRSTTSPEENQETEHTVVEHKTSTKKIAGETANEEATSEEVSMTETGYEERSTTLPEANEETTVLVHNPSTKESTSKSVSEEGILSTTEKSGALTSSQYEKTTGVTGAETNIERGTTATPEENEETERTVAGNKPNTGKTTGESTTEKNNISTTEKSEVSTSSLYKLSTMKSTSESASEEGNLPITEKSEISTRSQSEESTGGSITESLEGKSTASPEENEETEHKPSTKKSTSKSANEDKSTTVASEEISMTETGFEGRSTALPEENEETTVLEHNPSTEKSTSETVSEKGNLSTAESKTETNVEGSKTATPEENEETEHTVEIEREPATKSKPSNEESTSGSASEEGSTLSNISHSEGLTLKHHLTSTVLGNESVSNLPGHTMSQPTEVEEEFYHFSKNGGSTVCETCKGTSETADHGRTTSTNLKSEQTVSEQSTVKVFTASGTEENQEGNSHPLVEKTTLPELENNSKNGNRLTHSEKSSDIASEPNSKGTASISSYESTTPELLTNFASENYKAITSSKEMLSTKEEQPSEVSGRTSLVPSGKKDTTIHRTESTVHDEDTTASNGEGSRSYVIKHSTRPGEANAATETHSQNASKSTNNQSLYLLNVTEPPGAPTGVPEVIEADNEGTVRNRNDENGRPLVVIVNNSGNKHVKLNDSDIEGIINKPLSDVELQYIDLHNMSKEEPKGINLGGSHKNNTVTKCNKSDYEANNECVCDIDNYVTNIENKLKNNSEIVEKDLECKQFFSVQEGIVVSNSTKPTKRKKRSLMFLTASASENKVVERDSVQDVVGEEYKVPSTGSDLVVLPGSSVNIACQNMADNVAGELSTSYAWTFKKDVQRKGEVLANTESSLQLQNVEAKDYGNYTCSKTKNDKTEEFVHELQLITLPIYKITMEVSYSTSESCTLELEDTMYSYMPKIVSSKLCGDSGKVCEADVQRPRCTEMEENNLLEVTFIATINNFSGLLLGAIASKCDINCKLKLYASAIKLVYKNFQIIKNLPVSLQLNAKAHLIPRSADKLSKFTILCAGGYGLEKEKQRVCVMCPRNTFSSDDGSFCKFCPNGQYQPEPGSKSCMSCTSPVDDSMCLRMLVSALVFHISKTEHCTSV
ncbi:unnamed protein product [Acanthoscelides obtectus]|uniref:Ig-like domain-containing protein n=1 Tax=Acanthoscelides obtectus TaxID=200917 RepID=A0A9P0Q1W5_ACAOB|nr:unnamed protein product [Acanthoscelides obtectus]CAK1658604.1 hypothetical protein AOBTE_LOCUS21017 [Acanthoscelides obtectus]